jgi:hypothetical protein
MHCDDPQPNAAEDQVNGLPAHCFVKEASATRRFQESNALCEVH